MRHTLCGCSSSLSMVPDCLSPPGSAISRPAIQHLTTAPPTFFVVHNALVLISTLHSRLQNFGVDVNSGGVVDTFAAFVWEPSLVKINAIASATEAACLIMSVDETVRNPKSEAPDSGAAQAMGGGRGRGRGGRGGGRGMRR